MTSKKIAFLSIRCCDECNEDAGNTRGFERDYHLFTMELVGELYRPSRVLLLITQL